MNTSKRKVKQRRKSSLRFWIVATFLLSIIYVWLQQKGDSYDIWPRTNVQEALPITGLHPVVAESEKLLVRKAARRGIEIVITHDFRSIEEQDALYNQGRSIAGNIVTNAKGESPITTMVWLLILRCGLLKEM